MATPSHQSVITELSMLADALEKHHGSTMFTLSGKRYSGANLAVLVREIVATRTRLIMAKVELIAAAREQRKKQRDTAGFLDALRTMLFVMHAHEGEMLLEFAITARRQRRRATADELIVRTAKSRATRTERRTMGKRQKAAIKGNVTGVVVSPVRGGKAPA